MFFNPSAIIFFNLFIYVYMQNQKFINNHAVLDMLFFIFLFFVYVVLFILKTEISFLACIKKVGLLKNVFILSYTGHLFNN